MADKKTVPYERFKQKVDECNALKAKLATIQWIMNEKEPKYDGNYYDQAEDNETTK